MDDPIIIDTRMHGRTQLTGAFLVQGEKTALVETGPKTSVDAVSAGLQEKGIDALDWIVVTHIHLDHAGGAGTLAQRFPGATVAVHRVGAPHLEDPAKLWSSAARIYGDRMEELWGGIDPIPGERIRALGDGDVIDLGGRSLTAVDTPGHAGHHHAYLDDATGIALVGDALGVRLPDVGIIRPATPPPEFDLERAIASIARIRDLRPRSVWLTHFGPADAGRAGASGASVADTCEAAIESLLEWGAWVKEARQTTDDLDEVADHVRKRAQEADEGGLDAEAVSRLEETSSYWMNAWGYMRHLDKLAGKR